MTRKISRLIFTLPVISIISSFANGANATSPCQNAAPCVSPFKGIYLGGNVGVSSGHTKENAENLQGRSAFKAQSNLCLKGIEGGFGIGYTYVFSCAPFAFGPEFMANWAKSRGSHWHSARNFQSKTTLNVKNNLQLAGRFGWAFTRFMPYAKLGWSNAQSNYKATSAVKNGSKRINGLLFGVGIDLLAFTCRDLSAAVGLEYVGVNYGNHQQMVLNDGTRLTIRPFVNKFALTAKLIY